MWPSRRRLGHMLIQAVRQRWLPPACADAVPLPVAPHHL